MAHHFLKTNQEFIQPIIDELKLFELRFNDRGFSVGDHLTLQGWDPINKEYTGVEVEVYVPFILTGGAYGLDQDWVCMSIRYLAHTLAA